MSDDKAVLLQELHTDYVAFMQKLANVKGAFVQKQQAFFRFDEGHMWLQNAVLSYVEPAILVDESVENTEENISVAIAE